MERSDVTFESAGTRCAAWLYVPDTERPPCVVMAHGFAGIREARLDAFAERFAQAGYAALVFDYRHFGASDGTPRQLLDPRRQLADWAAAIAFARTLDGIDTERIALWGTSFSGGHVLWTAAREPGISAVIAQVPYVDSIATLRNAGAGETLRLSREGLRDQLGAVRGRAPHMLKAVGPPGSLAAMTSPDAEPGYRALIPPDVDWPDEVAARVMLQLGVYRPIRSVARIACPVLYVIADDDQVTPPGAALKAAARTPNAEVLRYPVGHFDPYVGSCFETVVAAETAFLETHVPVREARPAEV